MLIKRGAEPGRGLWSLPGGRVEPDETDDEAVVRELREETGLDVRPGELVGSVRRAAPKGVFEIFDYSCAVAGGTLRAGDDAMDAGWVDLAGLTDLERRGELVDELAATLREWRVLPRS